MESKIYSFTKEDFRKYACKETFEKIKDISNVNELLDYIKQYNDLPAVGIEDGTTASYNKLLLDISRVVNLLKVNNITKDSNVGLVCGNNYTFVVISLGIMAYGCVCTMIPSFLDEQTLYGCSRKYQLTAMFVHDALASKLEFTRKMNTTLKVFESKEIFKTEPTCIEKVGNNKAPACIIMTGGTTGRSKGALLSHEALMQGMVNGCYGIDNFYNKVYYCLIPLTHVFGYIRNLLTCLYTGGCIYFNQDKRLMFEEFKKYKPQLLVIVPALAELLLNLMKAYGKEFIGGRVETIICGAASVPPFLVEEWNKAGVKFCPGYGLTELANMVTGNPLPLDKPESVGMLFPNLEAKLVDGELWLRGRNVMISYYAEDEENKTAFEEDWFKTGDLARFDEDRFLYIVGRIKDVIVLDNGENVSPAYIETKVCQLPFIQDSLVTEDKNDLGTTILKCEVTLRQGVVNAMNIVPEKLEEFVIEQVLGINKQLQSFEYISKVVIRDKDFERSPAMKIIRPKKVF